jgi:hypothetical protein
MLFNPYKPWHWVREENSQRSSLLALAAAVYERERKIFCLLPHKSHSNDEGRKFDCGLDFITSAHGPRAEHKNARKIIPRRGREIEICEVKMQQHRENIDEVHEAGCKLNFN